MALHRRPAARQELPFSDAADIDVADTPSPDCREVLANFWDYLDGNCSTELAERIEAHVSSCARCDRFRETQERFFAALAELRGRSSAPSWVHDRVIRALAAERQGGKPR